MIRSLRAIVWVRWRLIANSIRGGRRRDQVEQVARAFGLLAPIMGAALLTGSLFASLYLGYVAGRAAATGLADPRRVVFIFRIVLFVMAMLQIILTAGSPAQTTIGKYTRLLLLPIPRRALHLIEVIANLADPWVVLVVSALSSFALGLATGGRPLAALLAFAAGLGMMAVLATLASFISFAVGWLFRSRRRSELFTLIFILFITSLSMIPMFLSTHLDERSRQARAAGEPRRRTSIEDVDRSLPRWTYALPSELYGRAVLNSMGERTGASILFVIAIAGEAVLLFAASASAHRRMLEALESDGRRRRSTEIAATGIRLPFVSPGVAAVAWAQARTALRSVRGRLMVLLPGPLVGLLSTFLTRIPDPKIASFMTGLGPLIFGGGIILCFHSSLPFTMNLFGSDRAGLTLQLLSPLSDRDIARGKILGCGAVLAISAATVLIAALAVSPTGAFPYWIAAGLSGIATYLLLSPISVFFSALFPQASDLSKTGNAGNGHPFPTIVSTFLVFFLTAPAGFIVLAAQFWWRRPALALPLMLVWVGLAALVGLSALSLAARVFGVRRENLALVAQGR